MQQKDNFDYKTALEELLSTYPDNKFYSDLSGKLSKWKFLTKNQIDCVRKDYQEKINESAATTEANIGAQKCTRCSAEIKTIFEGVETIKAGLLCVKCADRELNNLAKTPEAVQTQTEAAPAEIEKCALEHPHAGAHEYTKEYILSCAVTDEYIYDLRGWPDGITEETIKEMWDNNFMPKKGFFNSGHFRYLISTYKDKLVTFEEIRSILLVNKDQAWQELRKYEEKDIEYYWNFALEHTKNYNNIPDYVRKKQIKLGEPNPVEEYKKEQKAQFEHWREVALGSWKSANIYRKALGMAQLPEPEFAKISFEDAVHTLPPEPGTLDGFTNAASNQQLQQSKACARCGTKGEKAKISEACDNHAVQWVGKTLCWKCYVDTHVDAYLKEYLCPDCRGKITEWAGTYDNWCNMKCKNGHVTNVNFLIKSECDPDQNEEGNNKSELKHEQKTSVLTDKRDRTKEQLEAEFGPITQAYAMQLWNQSKISYLEYAQFVDKEKEKLRDDEAERQRKLREEIERSVKSIENAPLPVEKETSRRETIEQEAEDEDLPPIETHAEIEQKEKMPEKEQAPSAEDANKNTVVFSATCIIRNFFTKDVVENTKRYIEWKKKNPKARNTVFKEEKMTKDSLYFSYCELERLLQGYDNSEEKDIWNTGVKEVGHERYIVQNCKALLVTYGWCGSSAGTEKIHNLYHLNKNGNVDKWCVSSKSNGLIPDFMGALKEFVLNIVEKEQIPEGCDVIAMEKKEGEQKDWF